MLFVLESKHYKMIMFGKFEHNEELDGCDVSLPLGSHVSGI